MLGTRSISVVINVHHNYRIYMAGPAVYGTDRCVFSKSRFLRPLPPYRRVQFLFFIFSNRLLTVEETSPPLRIPRSPENSITRAHFTEVILHRFFDIRILFIRITRLKIDQYLRISKESFPGSSTRLKIWKTLDYSHSQVGLSHNSENFWASSIFSVLVSHI